MKKFFKSRMTLRKRTPALHTALALLAAVVASLGVCHGQAAPATLDGLREAYAKHRDDLAATRQTQRAALDAALLARLATVEEASAKKGDLNGVINVRETRAALEKASQDNEPFDPPETPAPAGLQRALLDYKKDAATLAAKQRAEEDVLTARYAENLGKLKRKLVTENKIDEAVAVQAEIEELPKPEAKSVSAPAPKPEPKPVAKPEPEPHKPLPPFVLEQGQPDPNRPEKYRGPKNGVFTGAVRKAVDAHRLIVDDGKEARHFFPRWIGGMPNEGGGFDQDIMALLQTLQEGDTVEVKWIFADRFRVVGVKTK